MFEFRNGSLHAESISLEAIAREGDLLAVMSAGAYAMCMSSNYNSRPRARPRSWWTGQRRT
jgi:diaminopimelate decarboxylase